MDGCIVVRWSFLIKRWMLNGQRTDIWIYIWIDGCKDRIDGWMDGLVNRYMDYNKDKRERWVDYWIDVRIKSMDRCMHGQDWIGWMGRWMDE